MTFPTKILTVAIVIHFFANAEDRRMEFTNHLSNKVRVTIYSTSDKVSGMINPGEKQTLVLRDFREGSENVERMDVEDLNQNNQPTKTYVWFMGKKQTYSGPIPENAQVMENSNTKLNHTYVFIINHGNRTNNL